MLKQMLRDRKGEMTINGALTFLLFMVLLILGISVFGVANKASKLHTMAAELTRYIEVRGCIDAGAAAEFARLETVLGIDATLTTEQPIRRPGVKFSLETASRSPSPMKPVSVSAASCRCLSRCTAQ